MQTNSVKESDSARQQHRSPLAGYSTDMENSLREDIIRQGEYILKIRKVDIPFPARPVHSTGLLW